VHDECGSDEADPKAVDAARHIEASHLLADNGLFHCPRCLAAVLFWPAHANESGLVELAMPGAALLLSIEWT